ncbi:MAG: GNAT family N-acetyltransferase, partial [Clostridiales bacterium]|nr:GNAT family N-acetyltransferase [Clostridiales bacterium]
MINFNKVTYEDTKEMIAMSHKELVAARDDYWDEAILQNATYYHIVIVEETVGYFAINEENNLLQYYLIQSVRTMSQVVLEELIRVHNIKEMLVETYDVYYLIQALALGKEIDVHTNFYHSVDTVKSESPFYNMDVEIATKVELEEIVDSASISLGGADKEWLTGYYNRWIEKKGVYIFRFNGEIAALGEMRTGFAVKNAAYLGVIVSENYRKKGIGIYVTRYLKQNASDRGYI